MFKLLQFAKRIITHRYLILALSKREIKNQYVGSILGVIWTFIQPMVMIFVFWFVFGFGFRVMPVKDVPFVVWLTAGMAPWFLFTEILSGSAGIVVGNAHLIKKTIFPSEILPIVKLISSLVTHCVFLGLLIFLLVCYQLPFTLYTFQFLYYVLCLSVLAIGIGWAVSALNVFIRDVNNVVAVVLQVGFWATPIFWDINIMPERIHRYLKLNPMFYIIQGYRESFITFVPFWHHGIYTLYFWSFTLVCFLGGAFIFRRMKDQFADVL